MKGFFRLCQNLVVASQLPRTFSKFSVKYLSINSSIMSVRNFLASFLPSVRAQEEEDLVDPQATLREKCAEKDHIASLLAKYQACNDRVNSRSQTTESCAEELMDYIGELDHCVAHNLFLKLK